MLSSSCSPSPSVRSDLAMPCQRPSGKNPVSVITSALTASGWSHAQRRPISPPQSCTPSTSRSRPSARRKRSTCSIWRSQVPGQLGRRVAEPGQVGRDRAVAGGRGLGQHVAPQVRGRRIAVQEQRDGRVRVVRRRAAPRDRRSRRRVLRGGRRPRLESIRASQRAGPDSSAGQSDSLLRSRPQVRILLGALCGLRLSSSSPRAAKCQREHERSCLSATELSVRQPFPAKSPACEHIRVRAAESRVARPSARRRQSESWVSHLIGAQQPPREGRAGPGRWLFLHRDTNRAMGQQSGEIRLDRNQLMQWRILLETRVAWVERQRRPLCLHGRAQRCLRLSGDAARRFLSIPHRPVHQLLDHLSEDGSPARVVYPEAELVALKQPRRAICPQRDPLERPWRLPRLRAAAGPAGARRRGAAADARGLRRRGRDGARRPRPPGRAGGRGTACVPARARAARPDGRGQPRLQHGPHDRVRMPRRGREPA